MNPYILGPVFGALAGAFMGWLMNERAILGTANWIPGFVLMGILWGISGAARLSGGKKDPEAGELLTETKAYKKKRKEEAAKDKTQR